MELELIRTYHPKGTNGALLYQNMLVCNTIELPWHDNQQQISCIPEGRYALRKRYSEHLKWHIELLEVPNRDLILIHSYNNALQEAKGCIAPVSVLTGEGTGDSSRVAMNKLKALVYPSLENKQAVFITIKKAII
ncbi:MAG: hypothetical protein J0I09_03645 [Sphingobacteriia bacterium]|nr:hypothetical protein [Sphingobacteriia bacterium]